MVISKGSSSLRGSHHWKNTASSKSLVEVTTHWPWRMKTNSLDLEAMSPVSAVLVNLRIWIGPWKLRSLVTDKCMIHFQSLCKKRKVVPRSLSKLTTSNLSPAEANILWSWQQMERSTPLVTVNKDSLAIAQLRISSCQNSSKTSQERKSKQSPQVKIIPLLLLKLAICSFVEAILMDN